MYCEWLYIQKNILLSEDMCICTCCVCTLKTALSTHYVIRFPLIHLYHCVISCDLSGMCDFYSGANDDSNPRDGGDVGCCGYILWFLSLVVIALTFPFSLCLCIKVIYIDIWSLSYIVLASCWYEYSLQNIAAWLNWS